MFDSSRRTFLQKAGVGLATIGASGLVLRSDAVPTQEVNRDQIVIQMTPVKSVTPAKTELKKLCRSLTGRSTKKAPRSEESLACRASPERNSSYLAEYGPSTRNGLLQG